MRVVRDKIKKSELEELAKNMFGDLVKAVVDIEKEIMAIGGELHADEEALLLDKDSEQKDLWGINIYPQKSGDDMIEFDSVINIRPSQNNLSRGVEAPKTRDKITTVVNKLIE